MPADSLFPSLILPSRLIELAGDRLLVSADLGALFDLNGHTLTANLLSTGFGTVWVMGPGTVDGEVDITVAEGKFIALTFTATSVAVFASGNAEDIPLLANAQTLSSPQKSQVHQNLSLVPGTDIPSLVAGKIPAGQLPALALTETLIRDNAAARLALTSEQAQGKIVIEADTGKSYGLVSGGNPATSVDWIQVGDRDIQMADVVGLPSALTAKAPTAAPTFTGLATMTSAITNILQAYGEFCTFTYNGSSAAEHRFALGLGTLATQSGTFSGVSSGTNTGDQTSIVGITGTLAQFNTAVTDANLASSADVAAAQAAAIQHTNTLGKPFMRESFARYVNGTSFGFQTQTTEIGGFAWKCSTPSGTNYPTVLDDNSVGRGLFSTGTTLYYLGVDIGTGVAIRNIVCDVSLKFLGGAGSTGFTFSMHPESLITAGTGINIRAGMIHMTFTQQGFALGIATTNGLAEFPTVFPDSGDRRIAFTCDGTTDTATSTGHGLLTGSVIRVDSISGGLPATGLPLSTDLYAILINANTFKFATTYANALAGIAIDIGTGAGIFRTGVCTWDRANFQAAFGFNVRQSMSWKFQDGVMFFSCAGQTWIFRDPRITAAAFNSVWFETDGQSGKNDTWVIHNIAINDDLNAPGFGGAPKSDMPGKLGKTGILDFPIKQAQRYYSESATAYAKGNAPTQEWSSVSVANIYSEKGFMVRPWSSTDGDLWAALANAGVNQSSSPSGTDQNWDFVGAAKLGNLHDWSENRVYYRFPNTNSKQFKFKTTGAIITDLTFPAFTDTGFGILTVGQWRNATGLNQTVLTLEVVVDSTAGTVKKWVRYYNGNDGLGNSNLRTAFSGVAAGDAVRLGQNSIVRVANA